MKRNSVPEAPLRSQTQFGNERGKFLFVLFTWPFCACMADDYAKSRRTEQTFESIQAALAAYKSETGKVPSNEDGLAVLTKPNFEGLVFLYQIPGRNDAVLDGWGTPIRYVLDRNVVILQSAGPDAKFDNGDDLRKAVELSGLENFRKLKPNARGKEHP